jgi:hypothetical protein
MNKIKYLIALMAMCIIIAPALSTSYKGQYKGEEAGKDCNRMNFNPEVVIIPDGKQADHKCSCSKSMIGSDDKKQMCDCQKTENCGWNKPEMGWDDKQRMCNCQNAEMKSDGKQMGHEFMKSMMGPENKEHPMCNCQNAEMKSDGKQMGHEFMKSMMGPENKEFKDGVKGVAVIVVE